MIWRSPGCNRCCPPEVTPPTYRCDPCDTFNEGRLIPAVYQVTLSGLEVGGLNCDCQDFNGQYELQQVDNASCLWKYELPDTTGCSSCVEIPALNFKPYMSISYLFGNQMYFIWRCEEAEGGLWGELHWTGPIMPSPIECYEFYNPVSVDLTRNGGSGILGHPCAATADNSIAKVLAQFPSDGQ